MDQDELAILISEVERQKARVAIEHDDLKEAYLAGAQRSHGYNKRECEGKLNRLHGEMRGLGDALTMLRKRVTD